MSTLNVVQSSDVQERYRQKVALCESVDPYTIPMDDFLEVKHLPKVTLCNIWNYFMSTRSVYSQDELVARKALGAHKFFESGWVRKLAVKCLPHEKCVVIGLVEHSERINEDPAQPWALCLSSGMILVAHCTCLAGLGEACSHVGAILYAVETLVRSYENKSKTDFPCQWNRPKISTIERFVPLAEMCFAKKEKIAQQHVHLDEFGKDKIFQWLHDNKEKANVVSPLTLVTAGLNEEFIKKHTERKKANVSLECVVPCLCYYFVSNQQQSPNILYTTTAVRLYFKLTKVDIMFQVSHSSTINEVHILPVNRSTSTNDHDRLILQTLIITFYRADHQGKSLLELLQISKTIIVKMSDEDIKLTEEVTKKQSESWL